MTVPCGQGLEASHRGHLRHELSPRGGERRFRLFTGSAGAAFCLAADAFGGDLYSRYSSTASSKKRGDAEADEEARVLYVSP